jgi:hypothetical protein
MVTLYIRRFNVFINRFHVVSKIGITGIVDSIIQLVWAKTVTFHRPAHS